MKDVDISICCITYNQAEYINDTLNGFLKQKHNLNIEIIIHDDCSTDGTQDILKKFKNDYPELITLLLEKENRYQYNEKMFYKTIEVARGNYLMFCEGDDYWCDEHKLQLQYEYMTSHENCSYLCHATYVKYPDKENLDTLNAFMNDRSFNLEQVLCEGLLFPTASIMTRRKYFVDVPDFYLNAPIEDEPIKLLCLLNGDGFYINKHMSVYRKNHTGSWNYTVKRNVEKRIQHHIDKIRMYNSFDKYCDFQKHSMIEKAIVLEEFNIVLCKKEYKELRDVKYNFVLENLSLKTRTRLKFASRFPGVYGLVYDMTHRR